MTRLALTRIVGREGLIPFVQTQAHLIFRPLVALPEPHRGGEESSHIFLGGGYLYGGRKYPSYLIPTFILVCPYHT